jgi:hypothetical protein
MRDWAMEESRETASSIFFSVPGDLDFEAVIFRGAAAAARR